MIAAAADEAGALAPDARRAVRDAGVKPALARTHARAGSQGGVTERSGA